MPTRLVVDVGGRRLAIAAPYVRELAAAGWVTPVPGAPPPVAGVTQLRGQILPVLDVVSPPRLVPPEAPLLVLECGSARAAVVFTRLCAADEPADEKLDVGALFDSIHR
jgi:chemotaxis signal transduction protein